MSLLPQKSTFDKYAALGLIRRQTHENLSIYNYTEFTVQERLWNAVTRQARGLVLDDTGRVIVRCLPKFFNDDEPEARLERPRSFDPSAVIVQDKVDGSLVQVVDDHQHGLVVTSKGSFISDHAGWAREIIADKRMAFEPGLTYVFELIHPENRIVIDYGDRRELVLLAVIETQTGRERDIYGEQFDRFVRVALLDPYILKDVSCLDGGELVEGVVANFGGYRVKIKTAEYVRLHRIVTGFTPKRVWEALSNGESLEFENMPEEFQSWLDETVAHFRAEYARVLCGIRAEVSRAAHLSDKELGLSDEYHYKSFIFSQRHGKDIVPGIWKLIKPTQDMEAV